MEPSLPGKRTNTSIFHLRKTMIDIDPEDATARFFYNHTRQLIDTGIPENKSGVVEMEEK